MDYYSVIRVVPSNILDVLNNIDLSLSAIATFNNLKDAEIYINSINEIYISKVERIVGVLNTQPTEDDMDGMWLVRDEINTLRYHIYQKKTSINKGYIYNSADVNIKTCGFLEICNIQVKRSYETNHLFSRNYIERSKSSSYPLVFGCERPRYNTEPEPDPSLNQRLMEELKIKINNKLQPQPIKINKGSENKKQVQKDKDNNTNKTKID